jgi:hypothetical protein
VRVRLRGEQADASQCGLLLLPGSTRATTAHPEAVLEAFFHNDWRFVDPVESGEDGTSVRAYSRTGRAPAGRPLRGSAAGAAGFCAGFVVLPGAPVLTRRGLNDHWPGERL